MDTFETRKKIGFSENREDWIKNKALYDDHTLRIANHPVMEDWELEYMYRLSKVACTNKGRILEVGYGMGLSAKAIQAEEIKEHFIIECHPDVIIKCANDLSQAIASNKLHILTGFWEDVTPLLADEIFDGILFDTYPLSEKEIHTNHFWFFKEAYRLLKKGGILTYYSDEAVKFSDKHLKKLHGAGFKKKNIKFEICDVDPPEHCEYWNKKTILVPIITK